MKHFPLSNSSRPDRGEAHPVRPEIRTARAQARAPSSRIMRAPCSAIMAVGVLVLPEVMVGMMAVSYTHLTLPTICSV